ncbi:MAG: hypothetical protein KGI27_07940 [Thaumarchaeota archaeon]|nr:hypothetical protein [Nitrososphaerota archaeon]
MNLDRRFSKMNLEIAEKRVVKEIKNRKLSGTDLECIAVAKHRKCLLVANDNHAEKEAGITDENYCAVIVRNQWTGMS